MTLLTHEAVTKCQCHHPGSPPPPYSRQFQAMRGGASDQAIWTSGGLMTLGALYSMYQSSGGVSVQIYYMDPDSFTTHLMGIDEVYNLGVHQRATVISEDGSQVTLPATGALLDVADWYPTHLTISHPTDTRYLVSATDASFTKPGNKKMVRIVTNYKLSGICTAITLPVPNMIAESMFVIMS